MIHILEFLSAYPAWVVFCIAVITIYCTVQIISWIKKLWKKRQDFQNSAMEAGEEIQAQIDQEAADKAAQEARIKLLEDNLAIVTQILNTQQDQTATLIESDKLNIKAWIKEQHEKWISLQCIDSQSLELICQRFEIYQEEGGNSWAEKMVEEIKELPTVIVIPVKPE